MRCVSRPTFTGLLLLALVFLGGPAFAQTVGGIQIVSQTRVNSTTFEITYRASLTNGGQAIQSATATLIPSPDFQVVDGQLSFGPAGAGAVVPSSDTFTLRQSPAAATRPIRVSFSVVVQPVGGGQGGAAVKLRVRPVANVRAGDPITVIVEALDANDVLDPNFAGPVTLINLQAAVVANGQTVFDAPVVPIIGGGLATFTGLSISNAADGYTFGAQATLGGNVVTDAIDAGFNVTARQVFVPAIFASHRAGTQLTFGVEARDANNVRAENFAGNISLDAAAVGGSNFTGGTKTAAAVAGLASFSNLTLNNAANAYLITGNAAGLSNGVSNSFNVTFTTLRVVAVPNVRAGDPFNVQVEALDGNGTLAENFDASAALSLFNLQAAVAANGQTTFDAVVVPVFGGGTATFTGLSISNAANGYTFSAATSAGGAVVDAIDVPFDVTARQVFVPAIFANHKAGTQLTFSVEARDANNVLAENFTGNINLDAAAVGGSNFTGGTKTAAAAAGVVSFSNLTLNNAANSYLITGSSAGLNNGVSNSFNVTFTTLRVVAVPNVRAGDPFNVQVEALDGNSALAENFDAGAGLSLVSLQAAVVANGQTTFDAPVVPTFSGGTATFTGLAISNAADGYTFSALTSAGGAVIDAIDAGFNVTARQVFVPAIFANHRAGTQLTFSVEARDGNNVRAENFTGNINLDAAAVGGSNFTGGTKTAAAVAGLANFSNLTLNNAANAYLITGSSAGLNNGVSNSFNVTFTALAVLPVPNVRAGDPFIVQVEARDANNAVAENADASAGVVLFSLQAAVVANGQTVFDAPVVPTYGAGTATFTGLSISNAANGYTFSAGAAGGVADAIDAPFNVTARQVVVPPVFAASHKAGTVLSFNAEARDANNAVAENFTGNISVDAAAVGGSNFTGGTKTVAAAGGIASYTNLTLNNAANSYSITGSAAGLLNGTSNTFNVTFSTLRVLAVANVRAGDLFNVQVEALDGNSTLAENFDASAALTLFNLQAAVVASGQTSFNAAVVPTFSGGTATFANMSINNAANGYTFSALAGGAIADAIDAPFNVTARQVFVPGVMANHEAGTVFSLTVEARDANNALAENFTGNINLDASAVGGSNFTGGTKTVAALAGSATFNNLSIGTAANNYLITGSAAGLISGVSNSFNVTGGGGGSEAESLELSLSQSAIGAGGTTNIAALVKDDLGEPIAPSPTVNYQIVADEGASGALPTVLNGVIQTSANTRGGFILHGQVDGTAVTDDVFFAVVQNAAQSPNSGKFVALAAAEGAIATKLGELVDAFQNNPAAIPAIKTALQNAMDSVPTTGRHAIQRARVVAPEVGFLPSLQQLNAAGFTETPADVAFGVLVGNIVTKLGQVKAFYDALPTNPAAGGTDSVAQLNQLNTDLAALQAQLESLDITPHAIVKHATAINNLIRLSMPLQMKSVAGKVIGVLTANSLAGLQSTPSEFFDGAAPAGTALALASPDAFYAHEQQAFFGLLGLFGGSSLQMNLVNKIYGPVMAQVSRMMVLLAANALLEEYLNPAHMEGIITGGSLSFFTFNAGASVIEGSGMNRENVASNEVFLIGCAQIQAVEGLLNAFNPNNIDSFDDIDDFFQGIVDALGAAQDAYNLAEQPPSSVEIGCILDGGSSSGCTELVYPNGFEAVSGCSGFFCFQFPVLILYHNKDTGHWASGLFLFVPE